MIHVETGAYWFLHANPKKMKYPAKSIRSWLSSALYIAIPAMLFLEGCALNHADRSILADHGVSAPLRVKMAHLAPLTLPEIVELSHDGMLPEYITQYLHATHKIYSLSNHDEYWLNRQGVSTTVIVYLISTPETLKRASDRMAILDWAPYYTPFYSGSLNTFGDRYYLPPKAQMAHSLPTLTEQQEATRKIVED